MDPAVSASQCDKKREASFACLTPFVAAQLRSICSSGTYSKISPGWQFSSRQIASSVENLIALTLPVLRFDMLTRLIPTAFARYVTVIPRSATSLSM